MTQEEIQKPAASTPAPVPTKEETPAPVKEVPLPVSTEKLVTPPAPMASEEKVVSVKEAPVTVVDVPVAKEEEIAAGKAIVQTESFKEEGYLASELTEAEKKALEELKEMVKEALNKRKFTAPPPPPPPAKEEEIVVKKEEKTEVETKEEETKEEKKESFVRSLLHMNLHLTKKKEEKKEETSAAAESKTEETSPVDAPAAVKTEKEEKSALETKEEVRKEEKKESFVRSLLHPNIFLHLSKKKEETSAAAESKTEETSTVTAPAAAPPAPVETTPAVPVTTETKKEEKSVAPTPVETKPVAPVITETKKEEVSAAPAPVETKPAVPVTTETKKEEKSAAPAPVEIKPAVPVTTETKKEEKLVAPTPAETKPAAPVVTETKDEKSAAPAPVETKPAAPVVAETKTEEKATASAPVETKPAAPVVAETKKEEKATTSAPVETKPAAPVTTETKKEEEKAEVVTIEKAFAAEEEGTKTKEAIEESIVSITLPETAASVEPEEISIWGIPLLEDERSDVVLLKFLRAREFKVKEAFTMLKNTVQWRKENKIDELVAEDLEGSEFEKIVFTHGVDKEGRVVIYSSYGEFQNKEIFSDKEKLEKFLKWRIQFQEKCVRSLDFSPTAKSSFVFVSDFKNAPGLGKLALWQFIRRAVKQFEDNYPEFNAKELFINVPWWYIPYYVTIGSIITSPRTRSKLVLAGPSKSTETIFKYIAPEVVPVKYGGLNMESTFTVADGITEAVVKSSSKYTIDLPASEGTTLSWELRVMGADVTYGAQFEPSNEESYTVIVSKNRKIGLTDEPVITDSFKVGEPGKVVITIDNQTYKKKKVLYRFKTQP